MTKPKEGQLAPDFELQNTNKEKVRLSDYKDKWVVLYFYPKDNTPGCTLEAMDFSKLKKDFEENNAVILGISKDSCESHQKFVDRMNLTINLLSDPEAEVQKMYGVYKPKKMFGKEILGSVRSTFLINPERKIVKIWDKVRSVGHADKVLQKLKSLN